MRTIALIFLVISIVGFADASYLTVKHYTGASVGCSLVQGCDAVTKSSYAVIMNVPVALLGVGYYMSIAALAAAHIKTKQARWMRAAFLLTPVGFAASVWFVYLQLAVIGALCIYCVISAGASTGLFGIAVWKKFALRTIA